MADAPSPQPAPGSDKKIGSLVERLRSYESDMARLKNIAPLPPTPEKKPEPKPQPINPFGIAGNREPSVQASSNVAETLQASIAPIPEKPKEDPQKAIDALHKENSVPAFHTIQTDTAETRAQAPTPIPHSASIPQQTRPIAPQPVKKEVTTSPYVIEDTGSGNGKRMLALSAVFIVGGLLAFGGWYVLKNRPASTPNTAQDPKTVVATEDTKKIALNGKSVIQALQENQLRVASTQPELVRVTLSEEQAGSALSKERFAELLSPSLTSWFVRALEPNYVVGYYTGATAWHPVIILKTNSYEHAYAGMIAWETTLGHEFSVFAQPLTVASSSATTTKPKTSKTPTQPAPTPNVITAGFKDVIIKNRDARVFHDANGRRLVFYSFINEQTIVITTDQAALEEIIARLGTSS